MSRRQVKREVLSILHKTNLDSIYQELSGYTTQNLLNPLFTALCHSEEVVRWHAISSFGKVIPTLGEEAPEHARIVMRRFLWSLNDESGGIGWGSPEAMAEIMCRSDFLRKEYLHMLISYMREDGEESFQDGNYLELPMLQRGLLWGIGRLCQYYPEEMVERQVVVDLMTYLDSSDHHVSGLSLWCLGLLGANYKGNCEVIRGFLDSTFELPIYLEGEFQTIPVASLARKALAHSSA